MDNGGCEHICENTIGSFKCSCNDGYELNKDGLSCDGMLDWLYKYAIFLFALLKLTLS